MDKNSSLKYTVAIVTRNRSSLLQSVLESICLQTLPPDRVLIVDNASTDATSRVCDSFCNRLDLQRIVCTELGVNASRNVALKNCKTDILVFTDDDAVADNDWLQKLSEVFTSSPDVHAIQGVKENYYTKSFAACLIQFSSRDLSMLRDRKGTVVLSPNIVDTCNFAIRMNCVHAHNLLFDTTFIKGGDRHFGFQVIKAGYKIIFCENAVVRHRWEQSIMEYFRMRWRAGIASRNLRARLGSACYSGSKVSISAVKTLSFAWMRSKEFGIHGRVMFLFLTFIGKIITSAGGKVSQRHPDASVSN